MIMKKLFVSMFALFLLTFTTAQAQDAAKEGKDKPAKQEAVVSQEDRVEIKAEELPEPVQTALKSEDYSGWSVETVYHNKGKEQYEVKLKNGTESKKVKFKKDGNKAE
jgi:methionine-rich copper-binding protein CopC